MLYLLDSNILIYAKMGSSDEQAVVSKWLTTTLGDREHAVVVCETSLLAFLRIATNKKIFDPALPVEEAAAFVTSFLAHPAVRILQPPAAHYRELGDFMAAQNFDGNLVMDAHLAVLARDNGAALVTRDKDFKPVPFLTIVNPLKA